MKNQSEMVTSENFHKQEIIGSRIESAGYFGTVRFIGALPDHPGEWFGIEWDNAARGKHNGSVNGIQYFQTKYPTSGSFVRRERVNFGKSLIEAIINKYGEEESNIVKKIHEQQIVNLQKHIKAPFIEFVGFDKVSSKQKNFQSLQIVSTRGQHVNCIGDLSEIKSLCPNIRQLDLSKNLLISWEDIFNICTQLEHLYLLNVSENILEFPQEFPQYTFPNVTVFICGYMNLTWNDIKKLSTIFPNINELRANNNQINDLTCDSEHNFNNLKILDLEDNPINNWNEIMKLKMITTLNELSIGGIGLEMIDFKSDELKLNYFNNLTKLCLNNNRINDWISVSELNRLPNLEELKFLNNPILNSEDPDTALAIVIAKIGSLKIHNGRKLTGEFRIREEFRRGCDYDYLKKYGLDWLRAKTNPENLKLFLKEHNRYLDLIKMYGELEVDELKGDDKSQLKNRLILLNLNYNDEIITKKLSPLMTVQKLKILSQKLFKIPTVPEKLLCENENNFQILLNDDTKELHYFSVDNLDTIFIDRK